LKFSVNGNYSSYGLRSSYGEHHYTHYFSKSKLDSSNKYYVGNLINVPGYGNTTGYQRGNGTAYWDGDSGYAWFISSEDTKTQYRYRDLIPVAVFTVTFLDWDGSILNTQIVEQGQSATPPANPYREGYKFTGWSASYSDVRSDLIVLALYEQILPLRVLYSTRKWTVFM